MRLLALVLMLLPTGALALSCLPPNPARELDAGLRDGRDPRLMIGRLTTPLDNASGQFRFEGRVLGRGVSITRLSAAIDVSARCVADWCGELPRRPVEGVFISEHPAGGFRLVFDPCGGGGYPMPDGAQLKALERCISAARCSTETVEAFGR